MVELESQLRELELQMADGDPAVMRRYEQVHARDESFGGDEWPVRVDTVVRGLGFTERQLGQRLDSLSGGELTRASLARALAGNPDVLLLDEPTNHLDIESIDWLQDWLSNLPGGVVLVSHDRWFIESTCTSVVEIVEGKARRFNGSFVEYRTQQALEAATHQRQIERWKTEVARLQRFVDKFSAGTRARQAQSRVKMLDKLRQDAPAYADLRNRRTLSFKLPKPERPGNLPFDVRGIELGFEGGRTLLPPTDFAVERGEKIALLGRNGTGKSTLLHALAAQCIALAKPPEGYRGGEIRVGYGVTARLLSQHDSELVDNYSLLGNMNLAAPDIAARDAMNLLGLFGFKGPDDAQRLVSTLSGGERRRLLLAMALTGSANVLLLDEPTNHLDIESREGLEAALADFDGTVILISHDRALVEGVATRTVVLHDEALTTVAGGYTQAHDVLTGSAPLPGTPEAARAAAAAAKPASPNTSAKKQSPKAKQPTSEGRSGTSRTVSVDGASARERREARRKQRGANSGVKVRRPGTIEAELEQLETELGDIQNRMLDPEIYTSPEKSAECLDRHTVLERDIAKRYDELDAALQHYGK
jgi:ATP-binding cassette subfamily F protein 3